MSANKESMNHIAFNAAANAIGTLQQIQALLEGFHAPELDETTRDRLLWTIESLAEFEIERQESAQVKALRAEGMLDAYKGQKSKVTVVCPSSGDVVQVKEEAAEFIREMEGLPGVEQARLLKAIRHMAAGTWPHSTEEMAKWTPDQFREAADAAPEVQV